MVHITTKPINGEPFMRMHMNFTNGASITPVGEIADEHGNLWISPGEKLLNGKALLTHAQAMRATRFGWTIIESTRNKTHVQVYRPWAVFNR